jgi:hypothetical protein
MRPRIRGLEKKLRSTWRIETELIDCFKRYGDKRRRVS